MDRGGARCVEAPPPDLKPPSPNFSCWLKEVLAIKFLQYWILHLTATVKKGHKEAQVVAKRLGNGR